ncbi:MAG: glycosyltransferase family 1 protein [Actinomycetota bacterium]|nr:glycosyltransferase family 1 protein [Actinomycetota bacterium]
MAVNAEQLLDRSPGGIGRYTAQLLTVLPASFDDCRMVPVTARHQAADVEAALAAVGVPAVSRREVAVQALPTPLLYEAWVRWGRPGLRAVGRADVVHAPSVAVPPKGGRPLVVTVHDAAPELFPEAFTARGRRFHRLGLLAAARRADVVITVSQAAADEIVAHSPIPAERIRVIPNGVDPPGPDPTTGSADADALERLGPGRRPYVLWVGSLEPRKGVGTLVAAMARLAGAGGAEVATVLAGYEGWLNDEVVAAADRAALGPSLVQVGRVSEADLWVLYRNATVFAFPSRHEGFGLPVVEAMSQGIPVVASDIPVMREVAGPAAVLVAPGDVDGWAAAIEGLLDGPAQRQERGQAGRDRSGRFTASAMVAATRQLYQAIGS